MPVPTHGETFSRLIEHLRLAQESAAMLAHLHNAEGVTVRARNWLTVSENIDKMCKLVTQLATGKLQ